MKKLITFFVLILSGLGLNAQTLPLYLTRANTATVTGKAIDASQLTSGPIPAARYASNTIPFAALTISGGTSSNYVHGDGSVGTVTLSGLWSDMTVVSVAGTTTLTSSAVGKVHLCTGTTSNYTINLPTAASCANKTIQFQMSGGLTKLVTLDANGSETIDGALTRIMWASESAVIWSDGTSWYKVAGRSMPMSASLSLQDGGDPFTAQSVTTATMTLVAHNTATNPTGAMTDTTAHTITILRPGTYSVLAVTAYAADTTWTATRCLGRVYLNNGVNALTGDEVSVVSGSWPTFPLPGVFTFAAGDVIDHRTYQNSGGTVQLFGQLFNYISVTEIPQW